MKAYIKIIAVFMAFLIVVGSVLGWNNMSFALGVSQLNMWMTSINSLGVSVLGGISYIGSAFSNVLQRYEETDYDLPLGYSEYLRVGNKFQNQIYLWYLKAEAQLNGTEYKPSFAYDKFIFAYEDTVRALYHWDARNVIENDDWYSFIRIEGTNFVSYMSAGWRWIFDRDTVKKGYQSVLDSCTIEGCHDFETPEDIIIHFEFGG